MNSLHENMMEDLNPDQLEAVQSTQGPLLILAGAGSGKTRTITCRIWYLIEKKGVSPWHIMAVTFTNKAAAEMRNRVQSLLHQDALKVWVSTFHAACVRILRQHITRLGVNSSFAIIDANDQISIVKKCINEIDDQPGSLNHYAVLGEMRRAKNELLSAQEYQQKAGKNFFQSRVSPIFLAYEKKLRENEALDFDDLLLFTYKLFQEHPDVLAYYQQRCQYIMVDEYQDTNHAQAQILYLLAEKHQNICVVGDDDQSIYRWRGADIHNILDFEKIYPEAKVIRLEQNYRSTKIILEAANMVVSHNDLRKDKKLWTNNEEGGKITLFEAVNEEKEAQYVSHQIQYLLGTGFTHYKNFAVLYRTNAQSRAVEEALRKAGLPYLIVGGIKFYERKEIKDLIAYLKVVSNPDNRLSLLRIINVPPRRIGPATIAKIETLAQEDHLPLMEALAKILQIGELTQSQKRGLGQFLQLVQKWMDFKKDNAISKLLALILKDIDYFNFLEEEDDTELAEIRKENVNELLSGIQYFENQNSDSRLEDFLDYVSLLSDIDEYQEESGAITLMTVHSAKGLEFPAVFMVGMEENLFPVGKNANNREDLEEERRLCYVGMTRAKKKLFLTHARSRIVFGSIQSSSPSRFIREIPREFFINNWDAQPPKDSHPSIRYVPANNYSPGSVNGGSTSDESVKDDPGHYRVGDWVYHEKWGEGIVLYREGEGEGTKLSLNFGGMKKKVILKYANLKRIKKF